MRQQHLIAIVFTFVTLTAYSVSYADQYDGSGYGNPEGMTGAASVGYNQVDDANCYTFEAEFTFSKLILGLGFFSIDNGNMPSDYEDSPPPAGVTTTNVGGFDDNESGGYIKAGGIVSGLRLFGTLGVSDVTKKYLVESTLSGMKYVAEEKTGDSQVLYGAGVGYVFFERLLLQYQYDNRRQSLFTVGIQF